ncbi:MAG: hypothetical protein JWO30_3776 [Fibrobacteres bacterium]|nr:hypothetical protein [Fibrobacterota bacterium]
MQLPRIFFALIPLFFIGFSHAKPFITHQLEAPDGRFVAYRYFEEAGKNHDVIQISIIPKGGELPAKGNVVESALAFDPSKWNGDTLIVKVAPKVDYKSVSKSAQGHPIRYIMVFTKSMTFHARSSRQKGDSTFFSPSFLQILKTGFETFSIPSFSITAKSESEIHFKGFERTDKMPAGEAEIDRTVKYEGIVYL